MFRCKSSSFYFKLILLAKVGTCLFVGLNTALAIPTQGHQVMISGPSHYAVEAGVDIAKRGGNVVDAAVAVGLTLAVTSPYYAALGGGGFALVRMGQETNVLDFREMAPLATSPQFYVNSPPEASQTGGKAVGVPGVPAGLLALHKKYGKLPWSVLLETPIRLAQKGFRVSGEWVEKTNKASRRFTPAGKKYFFKKDKSPYVPGEILKQKNLARVLKEMRVRKTASFYKGIVARDIVDSVKKAGGVLSLKDMKNYKVRWLKPMTTEFRGHKIYLMPPPSSGGVVIQSALNLIDQIKPEKQKALSVGEFHLLGEILSRSFRGRSLLGDPDFYKNPLDQLLSANYLKKMAKSIDEDESEKLEPLTQVKLEESKNTTHFSVLDRSGNAVALTVTLNGNYGSAVVSEKYGIALNNEMDDFTTRPGQPNMFGLIQGQGNLVQPGKRPLSSMSPTLVERQGKIVMSLGAPGGPRIISGVIQVLYRTLVSGFNIDEAIQAPRVHHQFLPHKLYVDKNKFSPEILAALKEKEHTVEESWAARVYGVVLRPDGILEAAYDSRGEGAAGGY